MSGLGGFCGTTVRSKLDLQVSLTGAIKASDFCHETLTCFTLSQRPGARNYWVRL